MTRALSVTALLVAASSACSRTDSPRAAAASSSPAASSSVSAPQSSLAAGPAPSAAREPSRVRLPAEEKTWSFTSTPVGRMQAVVLVPERAPDERFPVLITMHGRGEALKGPERGARGWVDDYWLGKAIARLHEPPLEASDFLSLVTERRLTQINQALAEKRYRGLIVVCPYTPNMLAGEEFLGEARPLARFLIDELLPRVHRETPALMTASATGIDGVSLGGRAAFSVGLLRPEAFGAVAGLQAAFDSDDFPPLMQRARAIGEKNPALTFRMLTSDGDFFRDADVAIARGMQKAGLRVQLDVVRGPHDYEFNRGPGAIEMLLFHDRVLRGDPPVASEP